MGLPPIYKWDRAPYICIVKVVCHRERQGVEKVSYLPYYGETGTTLSVHNLGMHKKNRSSQVAKRSIQINFKRHRLLVGLLNANAKIAILF